MPIICPPPLSEIPTDALPPVRDEWDYTPLPKPIPVTEQRWPEGTRPLVTVRCMTFNHERFIRQAIDGFLMQETTFPVQILVHDDASTDGTAAIVREYAERYPELIVAVLQPENLFSRGIRPGLTAIRFGRYEATCEGDDYWISSRKLQSQITHLEKHPDCFLSGARIYIWNDGASHPYAIQPDISPGEAATMRPPEFFLGRLWMHPNTRVYRVDYLDYFLRAVPQRDAQFDAGFGAFSGAHAAKGRGSIHFLDDIVAVYRKHPGGIWSGATLKQKYTAEIKLRTIIRHHVPRGRLRRNYDRSLAQWYEVKSSDRGLSTTQRLAAVASAARFRLPSLCAAIGTFRRFATSYTRQLLRPARPVEDST